MIIQTFVVGGHTFQETASTLIGAEGNAQAHAEFAKKYPPVIRQKPSTKHIIQRAERFKASAKRRMLPMDDPNRLRAHNNAAHKHA